MSQRSAKKVGKYELLETIGRGTFSKVKRGLNTETGEYVAIKIVNIDALQKEGMEKQLKREISVLKSIKHPNVVEMIEVLKSQNHFYIVMEMVTGGELFDKIVQQKKFSEKVARKHFQELIDGLSYCHSKGIAHRDLKPENLLLSANGILKISDFGLSGLVNTSSMLSTICGTPHYVAPEVLSGSYNGLVADIWSCGIILFVMLSGCHPFDGETVQELFQRIENLEFRYPSYFSKDVRTLLDKIIVVDPQKRATLEDIKNDKWFKKDYKGVVKTRKSVKLNEKDVENAITEAQIELEKADRGIRISKRLQNTENINAFELLSLLTKQNQKRMTKITNFVVEGFPDDIYERISKYLKSTNKCHVVEAENAFEMKCAMKGFNSVDFAIKFYILNRFYIIVEVSRIRGNTLKFHEIFRQLQEKFATQKGEELKPKEVTVRMGMNKREKKETTQSDVKEEKKVTDTK